MPAETDTKKSNPQSTAASLAIPIHPMLIPFPIAFLVATLACDLLSGAPATLQEHGIVLSSRGSPRKWPHWRRLPE